MVVFFDPGRMTARLALEATVATSDGQGGAAVTWEEVAELWAFVEPVSQALGERADGETGIVTHRIWLRHRDGIFAGQRFRKGARLFAIRLVQDPDETGRYLTCRCEEEMP